MDKRQILDEIFANDPFGLLEVKAKASTALTEEDRLLSSFYEITAFYEKNQREPEPDPSNISEYQLYSRLKSLRENPEKRKLLQKEDRFDLLQVQKKELSSLDDIFSEDSSGLLSDHSEGLFDFQHTPKQTTMPEYVAQRKRCEDFDRYEHLFEQCQKEIGEKLRKLVSFTKEQQIDPGCFFVLKGVLLFVVAVGKKELIKGKMNARLHCIFENGTESDMLLRSLAAELYKNGRRVTVHQDDLLEGFSAIEDDDVSTGYLYILSSCSTEERIRSIENLYKIGFSSLPVEERIQNADKEPTYLMAPVKIEASYQCANLNVHKLEHILHTFFGESCLNLDVYDNEGKRHSPREWFIAPFDVIEQAVLAVISGEILKIFYDPQTQSIQRRSGEGSE